MTGTVRTRIISALCSFYLLSLFLTGCSSFSASTEVTPETLYADNQDIDMFVYKDTTVLKAGTSVYSCQDKDGTERTDLLLVEERGNFTPYLKYVEG